MRRVTAGQSGFPIGKMDRKTDQRGGGRLLGTKEKLHTHLCKLGNRLDNGRAQVIVVFKISDSVEADHLDILRHTKTKAS